MNFMKMILQIFLNTLGLQYLILFSMSMKPHFDDHI